MPALGEREGEEEREGGKRRHTGFRSDAFHEMIVISWWNFFFFSFLQWRW